MKFMFVLIITLSASFVLGYCAASYNDQVLVARAQSEMRLAFKVSEGWRLEVAKYKAMACVDPTVGTITSSTDVVSTRGKP